MRIRNQIVSLDFDFENSYLFGFNGQEKDDEIGNGIYTAEFWEYDARLGRRWNTDPIVTSWESAYASFNNNPIKVVDPKGKFPYPTGTTNNVTSIVKNANGTFTISEETTIITTTNTQTTEVASESANMALGYKTFNRKTTQRITVIQSTSTIDEFGNVESNSATRTVSKAEFTDYIVQNPYNGETMSMSEGGGIVSPQSTVEGKYLGPLAATAVMTLYRSDIFPVESDGAIAQDVEFNSASKQREDIDKTMEHIGDPREKPADQIYKIDQTARNSASSSGRFNYAIGHKMSSDCFTSGSFDIYMQRIKGTSESDFKQTGLPHLLNTSVK